MGRPSISPEKLLRALLVQVLYTIRSERQLMEELGARAMAQRLRDTRDTIVIDPRAVRSGHPGTRQWLATVKFTDTRCFG